MTWENNIVGPKIVARDFGLRLCISLDTKLHKVDEGIDEDTDFHQDLVLNFITHLHKKQKTISVLQVYLAE